MKNKNIFLVLAILLLSTSFASAWILNGTIYDNTGAIRLYNASINVTIRDSTYTIVLSNRTFSNATGWFNISLTESADYLYQITITHFLYNKSGAAGSGIISADYVGQSLPAFPYNEIANVSDITFYLKQAGTINITAINSTGTGFGNRTVFYYQIKDTRLGFPIAEQFTSLVTEAIIYVPRDRNYSIMIYPNSSTPVKFEWNNFTSTNSYNFAYNSSYNGTSYTLKKMFNCTETFNRITGQMRNTTGNLSFWNDLAIVAYLLEPGDMISLSHPLPYNMSAWSGVAQTDIFNASGWYNMTLPGPAEGGDYILFAVGKNGTVWYGGYRNITLVYAGAQQELNFTIYKLMGTNGGSLRGNISNIADATLGKQFKNISSAAIGINLVNILNNTIQPQAHMEFKVDYTNYGNAKPFTFMINNQAGTNATIYLPLINNTGLKEVNIYTMDYAPKAVASWDVALMRTNPNITLIRFNPTDVTGALTSSDIFVSLYTSNSTCDVVSPPTGCALVSNIHPTPSIMLRYIIAGGKLSFRMGRGGYLDIHYVNVDMLASGPPDISIGATQHESSSGASGIFSSVQKFGSSGPRIYDYAFASIPYSEAASTGLEDSQAVNITVPSLYDESWNILWNSTNNGTNAEILSQNISHYSTFRNDWSVLLNGTTCTSDSTLNSSHPCYIDTTSNIIWVRFPHFSGTEPLIGGTSKAAAATETASPGGSSSSPATTTQTWTMTYVPTATELQNGYIISLPAKARVRFLVGTETHYVGVKSLTATQAVISIMSNETLVTLGIGEESKADVNNDGYYDVYVKLNSIEGGKANLLIKTINEKIVAGQPAVTSTQQEAAATQTEAQKTQYWVWIAVVIAIIIIGLVIGLSKMNKKRRYMLYGY